VRVPFDAEALLCQRRCRERLLHALDSQCQLLALAAMSKSVKHCNLCPVRSEAAVGNPVGGDAENAGEFAFQVGRRTLEKEI